MGMSFATTGQWFVTGGFYVPDPKLQGQPMAVYEAIRQGLVDLAGPRFVQFATWSIRNRRSSRRCCDVRGAA